MELSQLDLDQRCLLVEWLFQQTIIRTGGDMGPESLANQVLECSNSNSFVCFLTVLLSLLLPGLALDVQNA